MKRFVKKYEEIVTVPKLLSAWEGFLAGKKQRSDVAVWQSRLMDNILALYHDLKNKTYRHGPYQAFNISDPKPRNIHKAIIRDRLLHHLLYQETYDFFDRQFIYDSYSCRLDKGTHRAIRRFADFARQVSRNDQRTAWVLKCDIRKFFASINHQILKNILAKYIADKDLFWLFGQVIDSFNTAGKRGIGLPLGNLTSQLLVNIYLNEFDQFVKRGLKIKYYARYADDFIFLSEDKKNLIAIFSKIDEFLQNILKLSLHPDKCFIKTLASGVDFLGWVNFSSYRVLRTSTKRRMLKRIENSPTLETVASYLGLLKHGNAFRLGEEISNKIQY
ncbi:MAG TPA: reverse transcriptase/maturase family protein [Candidatus Nanoarchaeia archaeon]|nr:reverse transcriptase/maturase family protein [Candidatus Nanoarchaeia archaeon]